MRPKRGFTLVELLVVVALIVLLMALLAPALDRALVAAEMAVCGSNQHAVAASVTTYAFDYRRQYPYRTGVALETADGTEPHRIADWSPYWDDRLALVGYLDINKHLNDPTSAFVDKVNTPDADTGPAPDTDVAETTGQGMRKPIVFSDFYLWFGFGYTNGTTIYRHMKKIGDRIEWENNDGNWSFGLLASDMDVVNQGGSPASYHGSHPDYEGVLKNSVRVGSYVYSHWRVDGTYRRPAVDLNFAYEDGSVVRVNGVRTDDDERMTRVPHYNTASLRTWPSQWANVPKGD